MKFIEILLKNVKSIGKTALAFSSASFSVLSIILSFITWEEMGVANIFVENVNFRSHYYNGFNWKYFVDKCF